MSSANLTTLSYIPETTLGVPPATPAMHRLRYTGESLNLAITNTASAEIRPDRAQIDTIPVSSDAAGDINFELSFGSFDDFIAAAFANVWDVDGTDATIKRLTNGVLRPSFTVEKEFTDLTPQVFHRYVGSTIDGMKLSMKVGSILTGSFQVKALGNVPATAIITGETYIAAPTTDVMNAVASVQSITIDSVPFTGCASQVDLEIKNNIRPIDCIGSLSHKDFVLGTWEMTGSINFYFKDGSNYTKFVAGTPFGFGFELIDLAGNSYTFNFPRCKFESGEVVAGGQNTDVTFNAKFRALFSAGDAFVAQIEANSAA